MNVQSHPSDVVAILCGTNIWRAWGQHVHGALGLSAGSQFLLELYVKKLQNVFSFPYLEIKSPSIYEIKLKLSPNLQTRRALNRQPSQQQSDIKCKCFLRLALALPLCIFSLSHCCFFYLTSDEFKQFSTVTSFGLNLIFNSVDWQPCGFFCSETQNMVGSGPTNMWKST